MGTHAESFPPAVENIAERGAEIVGIPISEVWCSGKQPKLVLARLPTVLLGNQSIGYNPGVAQSETWAFQISDKPVSGQGASDNKRKKGQLGKLIN